MLALLSGFAASKTTDSPFLDLPSRYGSFGSSWALERWFEPSRAHPTPFGRAKNRKVV
jgi:hypothetical protein